MTDHPSFFTLDAHLVKPDATVEAHLAQCQRCSAHLKLVRQPTSMPSALRRTRVERRSWEWRLLFVPGIAAAAVAVAFVSSLGHTPSTTSKGSPSARVWLHRADRTVPWNGEPVEPGDAVRVEIASAGFEHLVVFDERTGSVLYEATVSSREPLLTPAWQLDDEGPGERLRVVLDHDVGGVPVMSERCDANAERWCQRFVMNKRRP